MSSLNHQLEALVARLNKELPERGADAAVSVKVEASAILSLGFDKDTVVTVEELKAALYENFLENVQLAQTDSMDSVELLAIRDE
ncbi:hypothetical protein [Burkholderia cenocepacia]|uniref:hypothetical protein n=1 Tax=Burkholderia cenocepacia TaxID=95486 RepID=UPI00076191E4|nr:hypothetical protein [Burkholderia cenocepacia]KWU26358.1 hypothetical protein AS149_25555 [Burkholderia cenocepacia]